MKIVSLLVGLTVALATLAASRAQAEVWPQPAAGGSASGAPEVIFTFDDGPREDTTTLILEELARRRIRAIFFWVGWRIEAPSPARLAVVRRAVDEGHIIAGHSQTHPMLCLGLTESQIAKEIDDARRLLVKHTGMRIDWFRAPYGMRCPLLEALLLERRMPNIHWDIDPQEWQPGMSAEATAQFVIAKLAVLRGRAVVLLHDTKVESVKALPMILDWIEAENARRRVIGQRELVIVQGTALAWERSRSGLGQVLADAAAQAGSASAAILASFAAAAPAEADKMR